jgi:uncharacterized protein YbjT (DUF2867 family)
MKIIITGSLGHISKPLAKDLIAKGHSVTVISSKAEKYSDILSLGATPAIGAIQDVTFLSNTFNGADAVYLMEPPASYFDQNPDPKSSWLYIADCYVQAVKNSGVKNLIHLSSVGAHTTDGVGMLSTHHEVENILKELPSNVSIKFMRPVGFYYNMYGFIQTIKSQGIIVQNYGGDIKEPWVSPIDIANTIAEEFEKPFSGRTIRYIASDEVSPNEVAEILGEAIGKPELKWISIPSNQFLEGLLSVGFNPNTAKGLVDMNTGRVQNLYDDYNNNRPVLGNVKMKDFAKEFALVYNQQ